MSGDAFGADCDLRRRRVLRGVLSGLLSVSLPLLLRHSSVSPRVARDVLIEIVDDQEFWRVQIRICRFLLGVGGTSYDPDGVQ